MDTRTPEQVGMFNIKNLRTDNKYLMKNIPRGITITIDDWKNDARSFILITAKRDNLIWSYEWDVTSYTSEIVPFLIQELNEFFKEEQ